MKGALTREKLVGGAQIPVSVPGAVLKYTFKSHENDGLYEPLKNDYIVSTRKVSPLVTNQTSKEHAIDEGVFSDNDYRSGTIRSSPLNVPTLATTRLRQKFLNTGPRVDKALVSSQLAKVYECIHAQRMEKECGAGRSPSTAHALFSTSAPYFGSGASNKPQINSDDVGAVTSMSKSTGPPRRVAPGPRRSANYPGFSRAGSIGNVCLTAAHSPLDVSAKVSKEADVATRTTKISPSSWRRGQELINEKLGPKPVVKKTKVEPPLQKDCEENCVKEKEDIEPSKESTTAKKPSKGVRRTKSRKEAPSAADGASKDNSPTKTRHYDSKEVRFYLKHQREQRKNRKSEEQKAEEQRKEVVRRNLEQLRKKQVETARMPLETLLPPTQRPISSSQRELRGSTVDVAAVPAKKSPPDALDIEMHSPVAPESIKNGAESEREADETSLMLLERQADELEAEVNELLDQNENNLLSVEHDSLMDDDYGEYISPIPHSENRLIMLEDCAATLQHRLSSFLHQPLRQYDIMQQQQQQQRYRNTSDVAPYIIEKQTAPYKEDKYSSTYFHHRPLPPASSTNFFHNFVADNLSEPLEDSPHVQRQYNHVTSALAGKKVAEKVELPGHAYTFKNSNDLEDLFSSDEESSGKDEPLSQNHNKNIVFFGSQVFTGGPVYRRPVLQSSPKPKRFKSRVDDNLHVYRRRDLHDPLRFMSTFRKQRTAHKKLLSEGKAPISKTAEQQAVPLVLHDLQFVAQLAATAGPLTLEDLVTPKQIAQPRHELPSTTVFASSVPASIPMSVPASISVAKHYSDDFTDTSSASESLAKSASLVHASKISHKSPESGQTTSDDNKYNAPPAAELPSRLLPSSTAPLRLSPNSLERRLLGELHYYESLEESMRQLNEVDRVRAVALGQQETVCLAQLVKARQWQHGTEMEAVRLQLQEAQLEKIAAIEEERRRIQQAADDIANAAQFYQEDNNPQGDMDSNFEESQTMGYSGSGSALDFGREIAPGYDTDDDESTIKSEVQVVERPLAEWAESSNRSDLSSSDLEETEELSYREVLPSESHRRRASSKEPGTGTSTTRPSTKPSEDDAFKKFTIDVVHQYMRKGQLRTRHKEMLLRLREKTLKEKTQADLFWLELQKNQLSDQNNTGRKGRKRGGDDVYPLLVERQRGLLRKYKLEAAELRALRKKMASDEQIADTDEDASAIRLLDENLNVNLKETLKQLNRRMPRDKKQLTVREQRLHERRGRATAELHNLQRKVEHQKVRADSRVEEKSNKKIAGAIETSSSAVATTPAATATATVSEKSDQIRLSAPAASSSTTSSESSGTARRNSLDNSSSSVIEKISVGASNSSSSSRNNYSDKATSSIQEELQEPNKSERSISERIGAADSSVHEVTTASYVDSSRVGKLATPSYSQDSFETVSSTQTKSKVPSTETESNAHKQPPVSRLEKLKRDVVVSPQRPRPPAHSASSTSKQSTAAAVESESDDSFSCTLSETASDVSEVEGRIRALQDELRKRRHMAERLRRDQRRFKKEQLKQKETTLRKQIEQYDRQIVELKQDLEREVAEDVSSSGSVSVRPLIKAPRAATQRATGSSADCTAIESSVRDNGSASEPSSSQIGARWSQRGGEHSERSFDQSDVSNTCVESIVEEQEHDREPESGSSSCSEDSHCTTSLQMEQSDDGGTPRTPRVNFSEINEEFSVSDKGSDDHVSSHDSTNSASPVLLDLKKLDNNIAPVASDVEVSEHIVVGTKSDLEDNETSLKLILELDDVNNQSEAKEEDNDVQHEFERNRIPLSARTIHSNMSEIPEDISDNEYEMNSYTEDFSESRGDSDSRPTSRGSNYSYSKKNDVYDAIDPDSKKNSKSISQLESRSKENSLQKKDVSDKSDTHPTSHVELDSLARSSSHDGSRSVDISEHISYSTTTSSSSSSSAKTPIFLDLAHTKDRDITDTPEPKSIEQMEQHYNDDFDNTEILNLPEKVDEQKHDKIKSDISDSEKLRRSEILIAVEDKIVTDALHHMLSIRRSKLNKIKPVEHGAELHRPTSKVHSTSDEAVIGVPTSSTYPPAVAMDARDAFSVVPNAQVTNLSQLAASDEVETDDDIYNFDELAKPVLLVPPPSSDLTTLSEELWINSANVNRSAATASLSSNAVAAAQTKKADSLRRMFVPRSESELRKLLADALRVQRETGGAEAIDRFLTNGASGDASEVRAKRAFRRMILDLVKEEVDRLTPSVANAEDGSADPWTRPRKPRPQLGSETALATLVQEKCGSALGLNSQGATSVSRRASKVQLWSCRKKKDRVDEMLVAELREEEAGWIDYEEDEAAVKLQLAEKLLNSLLNEVTSTFTQAQTPRTLKMH